MIGISKGADAAAIKKTLQKKKALSIILTKETGTKGSPEEKFKVAAGSIQVLSDQVKKAKYDQYGRLF
jgi:DnaJ-class molecular chaperone